MSAFANPSPAGDDLAAIGAVLSACEAALNASDTAAVLPLYAEDGVFMAPNRPSAVGPAALKGAYDGVFGAIRLRVKFRVAEIVATAPDRAFARTNSAGTVTVQATGAEGAEANQELSLFRKGPNGAWKIARHSFSTTNPPRPALECGSPAKAGLGAAAGRRVEQPIRDRGDGEAGQLREVHEGATGAGVDQGEDRDGGRDGPALFEAGIAPGRACRNIEFRDRSRAEREIEAQYGHDSLAPEVKIGSSASTCLIYSGPGPNRRRPAR